MKVFFEDRKERDAFESLFERLYAQYKGDPLVEQICDLWDECNVYVDFHR